MSVCASRVFPGIVAIQRTALVFGALVGLSPVLPAWEIVTISGREYVELSEAAGFYGLKDTGSEQGKTRHYQGAGRDLFVTVDDRMVRINGVSHWLAFPVIEKDGNPLLTRLDLGKTIEPAFRPQLIGDFPPVRTVVLDPGHGGHDNGAVSPYECEKNFALDVARRVRDQLSKSGVRVVMTRNKDEFVELQDRAAVASRIPGAIFVSIHFNAADWNRTANGFEIYCVTPRGAPSTAYEGVRERDMVPEQGNGHDLHSFALANAIYHSMLGKLPMADRGVKRARFAVLRLATVPAVLIEGGFLTNPSDAKNVASKTWRDDYASSIARGILEYVKLSGQGVAPRQLADYRKGVASVPVVVSSAPPVPGVTLRDLPKKQEGE